ncbi:MAG: Cys-tRNA(Pro) deacylase [Pseudomonadota bacterium]
MTPAIACAKNAKIKFKVLHYDHDPGARSFGEEAAEKLGLDPRQVCKTLVVSTTAQDLAVAVLPVASQLDLRAMAKAMGVKKVAMAQANIVERVTGYVLGGVSPLGQKKRLATIVDASVLDCECIYVSGGKRGLDIELAPGDLIALTAADVATIAKKH